MKALTCGTLAVAVALALAGGPAYAWKKDLRPPPFRLEAWNADLILLGTPLPPVRWVPGEYQRPFLVHEVLKGKIRLDRDPVVMLTYAVRLSDKADKAIVFCTQEKRVVTPRRSIAVTSPDVIDYVKGLIAMPEKDAAKTAAHVLRFIEHKNEQVAEDVSRELAGIPYRHLREHAKSAPVEALLRGVSDPNGWRWRTDLCALLLGHVGDTSHVPLLKKLVQRGSPALGALQGYILLRPGEGMAALKAVLRDPAKDMFTRYAAVEVLEFFVEERRDVVPQADVAEALALALAHLDLAESAVERFQKWGRWEMTRKVLALWDRPGVEPTTRRVVVRFALASPHPDAAAFVQRLRREAPEYLEPEKEPALSDLLREIPAKLTR